MCEYLVQIPNMFEVLVPILLMCMNGNEKFTVQQCLIFRKTRISLGVAHIVAWLMETDIWNSSWDFGTYRICIRKHLL